MTDFLFKRKVGETIRVSQAFGRLLLRNKDKPLVSAEAHPRFSLCVALYKSTISQILKIGITKRFQP